MAKLVFPFSPALRRNTLGLWAVLGLTALPSPLIAAQSIPPTAQTATTSTRPTPKHVILRPPAQDPGDLFTGYPDRDPMWISQVRDVSAVKAAARAGDPVAQFQIGVMVAGGGGKDAEDAARGWFQSASDQDYPPAIYNVGIMAFKSNYGKPDYTLAAADLEKAAKQGFVPAERAFGRVLFYGWGRPRDEAEGRRWLKMASDAGDAQATDFFAEEVRDAEHAKNEHDLTIPAPQAKWNGPVLGHAYGRFTQSTIMASGCPVRAGETWHYASMISPASGFLQPVAKVWAGCWRRDPSQPTIMDICPFNNRGDLGGICDYVPFKDVEK